MASDFRTINEEVGMGTSITWKRGWKLVMDRMGKEDIGICWTRNSNA